MYRKAIFSVCLALLLGWAGPVTWGQENQIQNAEFDSDLDSWALYGGAGFDVQVVQGAHLSGQNAAFIDITDPTVASIGIQQGDLEFEQDKTYQIGFMARADQEREMVVLIQTYQPEGPSWPDNFFTRVQLTTEPQTFLLEYTHSGDSTTNHPGWVTTLYIMLKGQWWSMAGNSLASKVWIDRVHVGDQPPLVDPTIVKAYAPEPESGATIDQTATILKWQPGDLSVVHDIYISEDVDAVREGTVEAITMTDTRLILGSGPPYPAGLTPGQSYFWRVDEVNDLHPDSPWTGEVWDFLVRPQTAWRPTPADGAGFVDPDQDLSWESGVSTFFHTVYFGTSFDEVSTATTGGQMMVDAQYEMDPLEPDTTYYWRVDEFAGIATYTGQVWSFTTAAASGGLNAEYFNNRDLSGDPVLTRVDPQIDFDWGSADVPGENSPDESVTVDDFSARWTGELAVDLTDTYVFTITANNGFRLWLDGRPLIDYWDNPTTNSQQSDPIRLIAGQTYPLKMEYSEGTGTAVVQLFWESARQNQILSLIHI